MSAPIVITMGDPSGVGAEVTAKALADRGPDVRAETIVIGAGIVGLMVARALLKDGR